VNNPGKISFGFEYISSRFFPPGCKNDYIYGTVQLTTADGTIVTTLYTYDDYGTNYVEFDYLAAGTYYIAAQHYYGEAPFKEYTLRTFSQNPVELKKMSPEDVQAYSEKLAKVAAKNQGLNLIYEGYND